jgi:6-phosphogluconolactonase
VSALEQMGRLFLLIAGPRKPDVLNAAAAAPQKMPSQRWQTTTE